MPSSSYKNLFFALPELIYHKIEIISHDCKELIFSTNTREKKKFIKYTEKSYWESQTGNRRSRNSNKEMTNIKTYVLDRA